MKKILVIGLLILGGLFVFKKTNLHSYASTLVTRGHAAIKREVPRDFEIDRVRNQIRRLDADVRALLGPIAEKQAGINRLERDIQIARTNLQDRREELKVLALQVDAGHPNITLDDGEEMSLSEAKARLASEFAFAKRADAHLRSQEKLLSAQRETIRATHEKLSKIAEKKREFEIRLAQLEAAEESLNLDRLTTPIRVDRNRVADIEQSLNAIEKSQEAEQIERELQKQYSPKTRSPQRTTSQNLDMNEVRIFLGLQVQPKGTHGGN